MERNLPFLLCFALYLKATSKYKPPPGGGGAYIRRGDLTEGFLCYEFAGLIFGGAYTWRGLFSEFYGMVFRSRASTRYDLPSDKAAWAILSELNMCVYTYYIISEQPFYGNYSSLDSHTNTVISRAFAYSSRWRRKP